MAKHLGIAYNLRLPPELKEKIAVSAQEHNRSMNADIVARLEQTFKASSSRPLVMVEFNSSNIQSFFSALMKRLELDGFPTDHLLEVLEDFQSTQENKTTL